MLSLVVPVYHLVERSGRGQGALTKPLTAALAARARYPLR